MRLAHGYRISGEIRHPNGTNATERRLMKLSKVNAHEWPDCGTLQKTQHI